MDINECVHCGDAFDDYDQVHNLQIHTPYRGYIHDECLGEYLYEQLGSYSMSWQETKELDGIEEEEED